MPLPRFLKRLQVGWARLLHCLPAFRLPALQLPAFQLPAFQPRAKREAAPWSCPTAPQRQRPQPKLAQTPEFAQTKAIWEAIFNESTDAIFLVEPPPTSRILDCNQRAVELFEVDSKDELIGIQGVTLQKQPYTAAERAEIIAELKQKGFWSREIEYVTKTGKFFWAHLSSKPIQILGQAMRLVRLTDISERKRVEAERRQAEKLLHQSEARFQQLAANVPGIIYTIIHSPDGSTRLEYISAAVEEILEVKPEQALADFSLISSQWHPDDVEPYNATVRQSLVTLEPFSYEWRVITPSGKLKWLYAKRSMLEHRDNGDIAGYGIVQDITNLKQTQAALQRSEERLRLLTDALPVFISYADTEQRYQFVNKTYETYFGRSQAEICGRHTSEIIGEANYALSRPWIEQALSGKSVSYEITVPGSHQENRYLSVILVPDLDTQSTVHGYYTLVLDISDLKRTEALLRQSEAQYLAILEDQTELITRFRPDGTLLFVNEAFCRYYGVSKEQVIGHTYWARIYPDDQPAIDRCLVALSPKQPVGTVEHRVFVNDAVRWMQWVNRAIYDAQGNLVELQSVGRDITDRKQVEESLRESEERFRQAFNDAGIGMALIAPDGQFLKVNRTLCEMLGYSEAELLTQSFQAITFPADLDLELALIQQLLMGERQTYQLQKRYIHKQGSLVWTLFCVSLVRDSAEQPLYFVSQIQDISDRHKLDTMKEEFISVVSHELRTPLTSIRGSLGILTAGVLNDEPETAQRMLQVALKGTDRLVRLVNDILDLERLESGKVPLVMETCEVNDLMEQAVELVQALADQSKVTLNWSPLSASVQAAPDAIVQTLTNLLSNAVKFSPPGGTVWLNATWQAADPLPHNDSKLDHSDLPHTVILFTVQDQGRGIPPEKLETIFGRFQQVDSSDSRQKGGTGLGLAICKSIVQQHDGQIGVESVVGQGSRFYFTLPVGASSPQTERK